MTDLVTWLRRQLDQDAMAAREMQLLRPSVPWMIGANSHGFNFTYDPYDGDRLLAEVAAKRAILDLHEQTLRNATPRDWLTGEPRHEEFDVECSLCGWAQFVPEREQAGGCDTVRLLAEPYADRPGYREEWRPSDHQAPTDSSTPR